MSGTPTLCTPAPRPGAHLQGILHQRGQRGRQRAVAELAERPDVGDQLVGVALQGWGWGMCEGQEGVELACRGGLPGRREGVREGAPPLGWCGGVEVPQRPRNRRDWFPSGGNQASWLAAVGLLEGVGTAWALAVAFS